MSSAVIPILFFVGLAYGQYHHGSNQLPQGQYQQRQAIPQPQNVPSQQGYTQQGQLHAPMHHHYLHHRKLAKETVNQFWNQYFSIFTLPKEIQQQQQQDTPENIVATYLPNLTQIAKKCHPTEQYASFNPLHRSAVEDMVNLYSEKTDLSSMLQLSSFLKARPEIHPNVWYASFLRAQASETPHHLGFDRPSPIELFPSTFFPDTVLTKESNTRKKRQQTAPFGPQASQQQCVVTDERVGQDNGPENALWYFREDIMLNAHHFVWHMLFPTNSPRPIQRRGELFYFFHHDLLARYTTERIAARLPIVGTGPAPLFVDPNIVLEEGYNPHLTDGVSSQVWAPRANRQPLTSNTLSRDIWARLQTITGNRNRILETLRTGNINVNGRWTTLTPSDNIDIFGELAEASVFSISPNYYGQPGVHNDAHWVIANLLTNFPQGSMGVMAHSATAMRDVIFYRLHKGIDNLFTAYKDAFLPPYSLTQGPTALILPGVQVQSLAVVGTGSANALTTFWNTRRFQIAGGLDFNPSGTTRPPVVNICAKHLDHDEFNYVINVNNQRQSAMTVMVRIFMAPRLRPDNARFIYNDQRQLFFALDSFAQIIPPGQSTITRHSTASTLTAPWPRSVAQIQQDIQNGIQSAIHCECGFPHHLLLPKGTEQGMGFDLFAILTDGLSDLTPDALANNNDNSTSECVPSHIHCGVIGQNYPDNKPMGYPFDRTPFTYNNGQANVVPTNIEEFTMNIPNAATTQVTITHRNVQVGQ